MRTVEEIKARIAKLEADSRHKAPIALVQINAPLALIQVEIDAEINALKWCLD